MLMSGFRVLITGGAGRIAYSLVPLLGHGLAFGPKKMIDLVLFDTPQKKMILEGVNMEIEDSNYTLFRSVTVTTDATEAFKDADFVIFLGALPRKEGELRVDLLKKNKIIFKEQAKLFDNYAKTDARALVLGNPANTNAWIIASSLSRISKKNVTSLMRLDHNRTVHMAASHFGVQEASVRNIIVWGNHSSTQYPCVDFMKHSGGKQITLDKDHEEWISNTLVPTIRERGAAVIKHLGVSSSMSAAQATCDHIHDWFLGTDKGTFVSMGVVSDGAHGVPEGLMFGFPVYCSGNFEFEIVRDLKISNKTAKFLQESVDELNKEIELSMG